MWDEFNIKTFDAETVVYRDGVFCPELSTIVGTDFRENYPRPIHIIYVGEITGNCRLDINIFVDKQPVYLSVRVKNKKPAFLHIFIKNAGKNSECRGHIMLTNNNNLQFECRAIHAANDTTIMVDTKLIAEKNSLSIAKKETFCERRPFWPLHSDKCRLVFPIFAKSSCARMVSAVFLRCCEDLFFSVAIRPLTTHFAAFLALHQGGCLIKIGLKLRHA